MSRLRSLEAMALPPPPIEFGPRGGGTMASPDRNAEPPSIAAEGGMQLSAAALGVDGAPIPVAVVRPGRWTERKEKTSSLVPMEGSSASVVTPGG